MDSIIILGPIDFNKPVAILSFNNNRVNEELIYMHISYNQLYIDNILHPFPVYS